jgi:hypothetical protein
LLPTLTVLLLLLRIAAGAFAITGIFNRVIAISVRVGGLFKNGVVPDVKTAFHHITIYLFILGVALFA